MNKQFYATYGSNLNISQMADQCPTAKLVGTGIIQDYALQVTPDSIRFGSGVIFIFGPDCKKRLFHFLLTKYSAELIHFELSAFSVFACRMTALFALSRGGKTKALAL